MSKLQSLGQAIAAHIQDGMTIASGCALESLIPFAAGHEIIRQQRRDLTLVGPISDMQFDQLIGAGCVKKVITSWIGNVAAGLAHNYRRAAEDGIPNSIEIEEHSNFTIGLGLQAGATGVPFLPTRTLMGSAIVDGSHFAQVSCPFTGEQLTAVKALRPDVALIHAQRADIDGNAHVWGNLGVMREAALAARTVLLTCEEIVSHEAILADPNRTLIPGFLVASVVHEPHGSFPSPAQGFARRDDAFYFDYHRATRTRAGFEGWLEEWIFGTEDHRAFIRKLGEDRIKSLIPSGDLFAPSVSFNY